MKAMTAKMAGALLAGSMLVAAAGPVAAADADPPGAVQQGDHHGADGRPPQDEPPQHPGWQHPGWRHQRWHRGGAAAMFRELGLTEQQRASIKSVLEAARPAMKGLQDQMQANAQLLRETTPDDKNYAHVVARVSQENGALETRLIAQRATVYADCYALLAPIQKTRLAEVQARRARWIEEHKDHMRGHRHGMDDGGPQADAADVAPPGPAA